jgi:phosphate transport system substrate-binding protein
MVGMLNSKFKKVVLVIILIVFLFFLFNPSPNSHRIDIVGSTSIQPLSEELANTYSKSHSNVLINVQGGGTGMGIRATQQEITDIGMSSTNLTAEDKKSLITTLKLGEEGIAVCVNNKNNVSSLTNEQIKDIFSGKINNWKDVGGSDSKIHIISREDGSGTLIAFENSFMEGDKVDRYAITQGSTKSIEQSVANDDKAIGYCSNATVTDNVRKLMLSVEPKRPFQFLIHDHENRYVKDFLTWVFSPEGMEIVKHNKIIPPNDKELEDIRNTINDISVY